jgi:hypothetical protein
LNDTVNNKNDDYVMVLKKEVEETEETATILNENRKLNRAHIRMNQKVCLRKFIVTTWNYGETEEENKLKELNMNGLWIRATYFRV